MKRDINAWEKAKAAGVDMSLIANNLRKTPLERIRAHDRALKTAVELRNAVNQKHRHARA
jgi:hypothetical protein